MFFSFLINGQIWAIFVETGEYAQLLFRCLSTKPSMITFQRMKLSADLRQIRYEFKKNWMCNVNQLLLLLETIQLQIKKKKEKNTAAGLQTVVHVSTYPDIPKFSHVIVMPVKVGSIAAVVPPASTVGYRAIFVASVVIVL